MTDIYKPFDRNYIGVATNIVLGGMNFKKVRMIDNRGKTVSGFRLKTLKTGLAYPPKHIRFGSKDYIVFQSTDGTVRILNRQGRDRVKLKKSLITSANPIFGYRNTFAGTTKSGDMFQVDSKGNILLSKIGLNENHQVDMSANSLVTLDENKLNIKSSLSYTQLTLTTNREE